jgi:hypothetical protein
VGDRVSEEPQAASAGLGGGHLDTEDLSMSVAVHPGCAEQMNQHERAALADLHGQRIRGQERVGTLVQRPGAEVATCSSSSRGITLTCDLDSRVMPTVSTNFSIRRVLTPGR